MTDLEKSIEHWERLASGNRYPDEADDCESCALCETFLHNQAGWCFGCPVAIAVNDIGCKGTPYTEASIAGQSHGLDSAEFKSAALLELEFLKSLLPKDK